MATNAAVAATRIAPPTAFKAVAASGKVTLSWTAPRGAAGVDIVRDGIVVAKKVRTSRWSSTSVRNGVTYRFVVRSVDSQGRRSKDSAARTVTPLAAPPRLIGVRFRNQNGQVTVTWDRPTSTLAATVRAVVNGVPKASVAATAGVLVVTGLTNDDSYLLNLETVNRNGTPSAPVRLTVAPTATEQASAVGFTAVAADARVSLSWQPVAGAQRYLLYRDSSHLVTLSAPTTKTTDLRLSNGATYRYQVRVVVSGQYSARSAIQAATPLGAPAAPGPVSARGRDGRVLLSWPAPVDPVAAYDLMRDGVKIADVSGSAVAYEDASLTNGTSYRYSLLPYNANGAAGPRSAEVVAVPVAAPSAPAPPAAAAGDDKVTLHWSSGGTGRWLLQRDGVALGGVLTENNFVDTSAVNGVTYNYALIAVGLDDQQSAPSSSVSSTPRPIPPSRPTGVQAVGGNAEVTLTWNTPTPAPAGYRVYRDGVKLTDAAGSPVRDTSLSNGVTYRYTVTAIDSRGTESSLSTAVTATPSAPPQTPLLSVEERHEEAVLHFEPAPGRTASSWRILRDGVEIATSTGTDTELTDRELTDGQAYQFQVQAVYADGTTSPLSPAAVAVPRAPWRSVAVGGDFACGVHVDGGARCWGANDTRQLGDGSAVASANGPVIVAGPAGVTRVAAGENHACAIDGGGFLWCWGALLGDPARFGKPAKVSGLTGVTAVAAGGATTCAVTAGSVWCLGDGADGQLGGAATSAAPVRVTLPASAVDVTVGDHHACAVLTDATVACWGADDLGQRSGTPSQAHSPVRVAGLAGVSAVSAGTDHTCVLLGTAVSCFGAGDDGQLGREVTGSAGPAPVDVPAATGVSAGDHYTCVTLLSGQARCFGVGEEGQLGDSAGLDRTSPVAVLNLDTATSVIAGGGATTCALTRDGSLWCFGDNVAGQHGSGDDGRMSQPSAPIVGLAGTTKIAMGTDASCAIRDTAVWCWGVNRLGAAGSEPGIARPGPVQVPLPAGVVPRMIAVGTETACVATVANEMYCWGANDAGQAGQPASATIGVSKVAITLVSEIAVGDKATCARKNGGTLWCFGRSDLIGAGLTGQDPHPAPAQVRGADGVVLSGLSQIAVGYRHACTAENYVTTTPTSGAVWCFGENGDGQLGAVGPGTLAQKIPNLAGVINLGAGRAHSCAVSLLPTRALWCFGANNAGQLGLGDTTARSAPTVLPTMIASRIAAFGDVTCVKSSNAQGWCFGEGSAGQVGNGLLRATEPNAQVTYDSAGIMLAAMYATNGKTSCAALTSGAVTCWGLRTLTSFGEGATLGYPSKPVLD